MDGWMDGWMYGCMYVCMDAWMHGCMDAWMHGCMDACMYVCGSNSGSMHSLLSDALPACLVVRFAPWHGTVPGRFRTAVPSHLFFCCALPHHTASAKSLGKAKHMYVCNVCMYVWTHLVLPALGPSLFCAFGSLRPFESCRVASSSNRYTV